MTLSTLRLYRENPYRTAFYSTVLGQLDVAGQPAVILEATCFYPTSGGQPHDTGTLNGVAVTDVIEQGDAVVHVLAGPLADERVRGEIDGPRRMDHMQQHTGQHILSQACVRELSAATLSFHLGDECSTIDIDLVALDPQAAARVEEAANAVVFADRPVTIREYRPGELVDVALRKTPQVEGDVRVVSVGGAAGVGAYDASACCGTHVRATGEVGPIHIRRWERRKGQTRIEFLCGWRALHSQRAQNAICQALASRLTVAVTDLPQVLQRLTDREQELGKQLQELRKRLLACEAPRLEEQAETRGNLRVLCRLLDGYDVASMRALAQTLTQQPDRVALLAVTDPAPQVCFARSQNVNLDMAALLRQASAPYGGRGGGSPQLATGGGVTAGNLPKVLAAASAQLGCTDGR